MLLKNIRENVALEYTEVLESKVWSPIGKGNRCVQSIMCYSGNIPAAVGKWNGVYVDLDWEKILTGKCSER